MFRIHAFLLLAIPFAGLSQIEYPDHVVPDSTHAPFYAGVASGDPTPDAVIIWSHIAPAAPSDVINVDWEVATDEQFTNVVASGTFTTDSSRSFTIKQDVTGLSANTSYYYRFEAPSGAYSAVGRTKTAPSGATDELTLAVTSCTSLFSGYFNGYARMAENDAIDLIVNVGDYIYDFVDEDEEVRLTNPYPINPNSLDEWRDRHLLYHYDVDFRAALQRHPIMVLWDNHDVQRSSERAASTQAFDEWVPVRFRNNIDSVHRVLKYGDLLDVFVIDMLQHNEPNSLLGAQQTAWFQQELDNSTAKWRVIGNQKLFADLGISGLGSIPIVGDLINDAFGALSAWNGNDAERDEILSYLADNGINNNVFIAGDVHMAFVSDLAPDPFGPDYNGETGAGSVAVEFLPTSMSRGNLDELLGGSLGSFAGPLVEDLLVGVNPHIQYYESISHGYGLMTFREDSVVAQVYFCDILNPTTDQTLAGEFVLYDGANHWKREGDVFIDTTTTRTNLAPQPYRLAVFPNPAGDAATLQFEVETAQEVRFELYELPTGRLIRELGRVRAAAGQLHSLPIHLTDVPAGRYMVLLTGEQLVGHQHLVRQ